MAGLRRRDGMLVRVRNALAVALISCDRDWL